MSEEVLTVAAPEGGFITVPDVKGAPIPDEETIKNIRESVQFDLPVFKKQPKRDDTMIFVAGGPTTLQYIDEIKERHKNGEFIVTSNNTYDFLIDNGVVANICLLIDPKEIVHTYVKKPHIDTTFYVGVVANPKVFQGLLDKGMKVIKLLVAYGCPDEADLDTQKELYEGLSYSFLVGGTMTGLRAMNFANLMGFRKLDYYGLDSCFGKVQPKIVYDDEPGFAEVRAKHNGAYYTDTATGRNYALDEDGGFFYAYGKARQENIMVALTPDGTRFLTCPVMAHQAKQFIKWYERMEEKIQINVIGESLTSHLLKNHLDIREKNASTIGDLRYTPDYEKLQRQLHKDGYEGPDGHKLYGYEGYDNFGLVKKGVDVMYEQLRRKMTMLDYGCGKGGLKFAIEQFYNVVDVTNYDPFVEEYQKEPDTRFDVVAVMDVMEHIEPPCVDNVLKHMEKFAKCMIIFKINLTDALKELPDGRNTHVLQRSAPWWIKKIGQYFSVVEAIANGNDLILLAQHNDARLFYDRENGVTNA